MTKWTDKLYQRSLSDRQELIAKNCHLDPEQIQGLTAASSPTNNEIIENYFMDYKVPEGLLVGLTVNGREYHVPMVTEEPSVVAAACNGAGRVNQCGGFVAPQQKRLVIGQVVLDRVQDPQKATDWIISNKKKLLKIANDARTSMKKRGAGAKDLRVRKEETFVSVDLLIDVSQSMGANSVNTMAEAVANYFKNNNYDVLTAILSNYVVDSLQTVTCKVSFAELATQILNGKTVAKRIARLSDLAQLDPYRAVTHNKGIMNGVDAVMIASGNDWRAAEASVHAYASRNGHYQGVSRWRVEGNYLVGKIALPLIPGIVGGSIKISNQSKINYQISQIKTAEELAAVTASVGLAQNLSALRALASTGIQAGHMKLQYRSLAMSIGAKGKEIDQLSGMLSEQHQVDHKLAKTLLEQIREEDEND